MLLLVGDHLDAVLDIAQEQISVGQFVARRNFDPAARRQLLQHVERRAPAQAVVAAADDELLRLDEKLDFTNAAAA